MCSEKSIIANILPHLPEDCKFTVFQYLPSNRNLQPNNSSLPRETKSMRCRRTFIHAILYCLKRMCDPWDNIQISEVNLSRWPIDRDLADLICESHPSLAIVIDNDNETENCLMIKKVTRKLMRLVVNCFFDGTRGRGISKG